ncbi:HNH endonuclease [Streptococcus panodentis]|uniref:HNH endonuclease n=1 Tax=Streptococcus panodentis TaxID=1581472 RepID=A0ABS5AUE9_9STRE|nr:HNH endonuclease [Streptococcus panodentis]MBP2619878.1 hypothetical protein [Streptococcus panodentis]
MNTNFTDSLNVKEKETDNFKKITPETGITLEEARDFTKNLLSKASENRIKDIDSNTDSEKVVKNIPSANGEWEGEPGNSKWIPDDESINPNLQTNPEQKNWGDIKQEYNFDGIVFRNCEPDFSKVSKGTVEIDSFSENRAKNFAQADIQLAKQRNCSPEEIRQFRKENKLTWHERSDMKTMDLVPSIIHGGIPHSGGIARIKALGKEGGENNE